MFSLEAKVALVTGAGANGGIGHAIALGYARAGARLALCDIDATGLAQTVREVEALGGEVLSQCADIADEAQMEGLFHRIDQAFGRLDVLVNVPFAFPSRARPHQLNLADWQRTLDVSLTGYFLCAKLAIARMLEQPEGGAIINIGSNAGIGALGRGALAYASAKAAVHQLTRELAVEYARERIRCNALVPAQVKTPGLSEHLDNPDFRDRVLPKILDGLPYGRLLDPDDLVGPAVFLASDAARAVNGVLLPVDQGNTALNAGGSVGEHRA